MNTKPTLEEFLEKVESFKEKSGADLSTSEDLSVAVMNLISLEEHFFFSGAKTKNDAYFDTIQEVRSLRKELLAKLMPENEGETWCIAKHLLAATMRLIEVGNKLKAEKNSAEAKRMFTGAYKTYSLFWALKVRLIKGRDVKDAAKRSATFEDLVAKLADCCDE